MRYENLNPQHHVLIEKIEAMDAVLQEKNKVIANLLDSQKVFKDSLNYRIEKAKKADKDRAEYKHMYDMLYQQIVEFEVAPWWRKLFYKFKF